MKKIIFLGDSGTTSNFLQAYRQAYIKASLECFDMLKVQALQTLKKRFKLQSEQLSAVSVEIVLNKYRQRNLEKIKKDFIIDQFYYEKSSIDEYSGIRCFISSHMSEEKAEELSSYFASQWAPQLVNNLCLNKKKPA